MTRFRYSGADRDGNIEEGWIDSADQQDAYQILRSRGLTPFELEVLLSPKDDQKPWYLKDLNLRGRAHSLSAQASVADMIGTLSELDLPMTEMFQIVIDSTSDRRLRTQLSRTKDRVADGMSLSQAFEVSGDGFSPLFLQILKIAEQSNRLSVAMTDLGRQLQRQQSLRTRLQSALIYPTILVLAAIALIGIVIGFLAPTLEPMFIALDRPPPASIEVFLWLGDVIARFWMALLATVMVGGLVVFAALRRTTIRNQLFSSLPHFGSLHQSAALLRLVSTTEMLLRSGTGLADALDVAGSIHQGDPFSDTFLDAAKTVRQGGTASSVFEEESAVDPVFRGSFRVGENVDRLPQVLSTVAKVLDTRIQSKIDRSLQLLTPALTLVLGSVIALLIYTVMSAILEINTAAF